MKRQGKRGWMVAGVFTAVAAAGLSLMASPARAQATDTLSQRGIPEIVMATLNARFPQAQIRQWTREKEGGVVLYDIEFEQRGRKFEADVKEDGNIQNWEREIAPAELPEAVTEAVEDLYPGSTMGETMEITAVVGGSDTLEGYEIMLEMGDGKEVEVAVAPDGTILEEESGEPN